SVVGFDDVDLAASTDPPLTTVHQPVRGKGEAAVRLLLSVMEGGHATPVHRRLETRLVIRSSTGPASQAGRRGRRADRSEPDESRTTTAGRRRDRTDAPPLRRRQTDRP